MVTKGIIKSIDYNGNTCKVRVPILESACDDAEIVLSAIFATAPGVFNGYKEEDVVIVSFEDNNYENAIILGKLYLGASKESEDPRGTVSCSNLKSENQATIPLSSKLVYDAKDKNTANVKGSYNDYKTLADIVDGLQTQKTEMGSLNVKIIDDGEQLGARVSKVEKDNVEQASKLALHSDKIEARVTKYSKDSPKECVGFGWSMDEHGIKFTSALGNKEEGATQTDVLTVDANGATITGKLTVKDSAEQNSNIIFEADPFGKPASGEEKEIKPHVLIGGFEVDKTSLSATIDTKSTNVDDYVERSFSGSDLTYARIIDGNTDDYTSLAPTNTYYHNAGDLDALAIDQEKFSQIYKDDDLLKELDTRPWLELSVNASDINSQHIYIYNHTTIDHKEKKPTTDIWDIYFYDDETNAWEKDASNQLITNVITHYKAQVYVGTDKIEVTNGDKIVKLQNGNLFANSADISGTITATAGNIGGFKLQNKDLIAQQSSEDDIVPLVSWFGTPLADKRIWNAAPQASENSFNVSNTAISGWQIKYIYYEYNEEAPAAFDATGTPTEEQIKNKLTLYLVLVINGKTTQEYKFKTTIKDYSIWERKEINAAAAQDHQFIATKIPVDISNSSLATTRISPKELFIGYEKNASTGYDSDYWFTLTPEMLTDSSIDINSLKDSELYAAIFKKDGASGNGTPWSNLKFSLKEENPDIVIVDSKLTLKLGHVRVIHNHPHVPPITVKPDIGIVTKPGITKPGVQIKPLQFSIANTGASVTPDISLGKDENLGGGMGDIKTRTIYHYYNIAQIDPVKDEITWQSTSGPDIKTRYLFPYQLKINGTTTEVVKIPLIVKVPKKDSYVKAEANGALIANNATISGNLNADAGKVGCFDIYETGLYSDFIELNKDSLVLTGGKFTLSSSNNGDSISLDTTSKSDPAIIFSGNGSIVDQTGSVGLRFEAGESKKEITYKAFLYATGTDGWGGNNSITITTKAYDPSSKNWNTRALKKDRTFTIYHKGYDMGDKIRQLTVTLKAGEYTKTVEFGGYWNFYGASWTYNGSFDKNKEVDGSPFTQTEVVPASLYALSSILPQSAGATSGTISVYYNTSYGPPVNDYEYGGTIQLNNVEYHVWSGNHGSTGHPNVYYTKDAPENIKAVSDVANNNDSTTLYYNLKDGKFENNNISSKSSMYVQSKSITTASGCSLGLSTAPWAAIWTKKVTGEVINLSSDLRLKQNINYDISKYDSLFDSLKPASYKFKSDLNQKTHLGFIAQEVEQSLFDNNLTRKDFAGVTIYGEGFDEKTDTILNLDKTTYALGYNELHALEVRQIQLLKARVQELEKKIEQLIKNKE